MEDWQERVVKERGDLSEKLTRLSAAISVRTLPLSEEDWELLRRQRDAMVDYYVALDERVRRFS